MNKFSINLTVFCKQILKKYITFYSYFHVGDVDELRQLEDWCISVGEPTVLYQTPLSWAIGNSEDYVGGLGGVVVLDEAFSNVKVNGRRGNRNYE